MMLDIVCYYVDLGRPYEPLIERMTRTAKAVMPEARTVLLTPNAGEDIRKHFDLTCQLPGRADETNLCLERVRAIVSWQTVTERPAIHCDPDLEWVSDPRAFFDGGWDVGLLWRGHKPDQPINTGMILAMPGSQAFWNHYGNIAVNLPPEIHSWWCDQMAFALLTGVCNYAGHVMGIDGAGVKLLDGKAVCPAADEATSEAWALHYKGPLKEGDYWRKVYRSRKVGRYGDGNSSPDSVSCTVSGTAPS